MVHAFYVYLFMLHDTTHGVVELVELSADRSKWVGSGGHGWAMHAGPPVGPASDVGAAAAFAEEERCDLIGGTGRRGRVGKGRLGRAVRG